MKNASIYFWSGTGNSRRIANYFSTLLSDAGIMSSSESIDSPLPPQIEHRSNSDLIGVVFPTHGFTVPWHVIKSLHQLPTGKSSRAVVIATRAGFKIGKFFPPGISGTATFIAATILKAKGYKVVGILSVDMPSNWFAVHPIQSKHSHEAIFERAEHNTRAFADKVVSNNNALLSINNTYEALMGILLSPISLSYLLMGRFFLSKLLFANSNCTSCDQCTACCSVRGVTLKGKEQKPYWNFHCENCMRCAAICPHQAIEAGHSWGMIFGMITFVPAIVWAMDVTSSNLPFLKHLNNEFINNLLRILFLYPAIALVYFIFQRLLSLRFFNQIFTLTTFTHLKKWGRYKEPSCRKRELLP